MIKNAPIIEPLNSTTQKAFNATLRLPAGKPTRACREGCLPQFIRHTITTLRGIDSNLVYPYNLELLILQYYGFEVQLNSPLWNRYLAEKQVDLVSSFGPVDLEKGYHVICVNITDNDDFLENYVTEYKIKELIRNIATYGAHKLYQIEFRFPATTKTKTTTSLYQYDALKNECTFVSAKTPRAMKYVLSRPTKPNPIDFDYAEMEQRVSAFITEKEKTMRVVTKQFINGTNVNDMNNDDLIMQISDAEARIKQLKSVETKSKAIMQEVKNIETFIDDVVTILDNRD